MENYMKFEMIGKGCGGNCVFLVKNLSDNKLYAMKRIIVDVNDEKQNLKNMNEIEIFQKLNHPNLIKYIESFIQKDKLCIIMEYADGGDLSAIVKEHAKNKLKIDEQMIWNWFLQLCQAIKYIHSKKILHRDIKCQNIFLTKKGQIKLGDFGISKILLHSFDFAKTPLGTPYFLSPEICSGSKYNFKTDIWMIGCVLYELAALRKPFEGDNLPSLMVNILKNDVLPIPKTYSDELKFLISQLLIKDANHRPSLSEILKYDFIITKMTNLGLDDTYENWDECPNCQSPVNEDSPSFPLFNLKFDNIVKIRETDEEDLSSSVATETKVVPEEKKIMVARCSGSIMQRMQKKKYSPSYGVEEMNQVMKGLRMDNSKKNEDMSKKNSGTSTSHYNGNSSSNVNALTKLHSNEPMRSKVNLAKNQYSEPNLKNGMKSRMPGSQFKENPIGQLEKLTMEEKIRRNRNNSISLSKGDNIIFLNHAKSRQDPPIPCKNLITPSELEKKLIPNPKITQNSNRSSITNTNSNTNSVLLSSPSVHYCSPSACDNSSFCSNNTNSKHRTKEFSSKKQTPKQIFISMDIDSPEHKTIIYVEEENHNGKNVKGSIKEHLIVQKDSIEEECKAAPTPSAVVHDNKYPKVSLRYQYYESIYGAQNMEKLVKVIEDSMGEAIKTEKDIEEIFSGCQKENYAAQLFKYACYIANLCYGKLSR